LIFKNFPLLRTLIVRFYRQKNQQHTISIHAYRIHTQDMQHITQSLSIRNKHVQITESITIFTKEYTTLIITKQFIMAIKPYPQANNLQASIWIKTWQPAYFHVANTITEPIQLESIQKKFLVN
jgi:uncharacterized membrane protein